MSRLLEHAGSFLSRWSRRKRNQQDSDQQQQSPLMADDLAETQQTNPDNLSLPVWQQQDVDPGIKKQVLKRIFRQAEFNHLDGLNDYDEDYTTFSNLGDVVTEQMRRMLRLAEQKKRPDTPLPAPEAVSRENEPASDQEPDKNHNNEDNKFA